MRRLLLLGLLPAAFVALLARSELRAARSQGSPVENLRGEVDRILDRGRYGDATWGLLAVSLDRGDTLLVRNPDRPLLPASNLKLVTSAAVLHHLGPDYRYATWLLASRPVVDGVLEGDLVIYGTGDPGISDRYHPSADSPLRELAARLREAGIREIRGRVVGDGTFFPGPLLGEGWESRDLNEWFAAPSAALSYNENVVAVWVRPSTPGRPPEIGTEPRHLGLLIANEARTVEGRPGAPLWLLRTDPEEPVRAVGELSVSSRDVWREMTLWDPAMATAHALTHVLREEGISVRGYPTAVPHTGPSPLTSGRVWGRGDSLRVLASFRSPPAAEYLTAVNRRSHNLYADLLLKTLGQTRGQGGTFQEGGRVVEEFLGEVVGVPADQVTVVDGSGLSSLNRLSASALVETLRHLHGTPEWEILRESLPVAGSRDLFRRMIRTPASGNLRAKTGTMDRVSGLSGVVTTASGEQVLFSIIGNDLPSETGAKRLEDRVGEALASFRR